MHGRPGFSRNEGRRGGLGARHRSASPRRTFARRPSRLRRTRRVLSGSARVACRARGRRKLRGRKNRSFCALRTIAAFHRRNLKRACPAVIKSGSAQQNGALVVISFVFFVCDTCGVCLLAFHRRIAQFYGVAFLMTGPTNKLG